MDSQETFRQRAQALRKNLTKEERHLWYDFLKTYPVQFKRQYALGAYIVDFYCFRAKLIVELDGSQHCQPEAVAYDQRRSEFLEQQGFFVLRISNRDVMMQFRAVCEHIDMVVKNRVGHFLMPSSVSNLPMPGKFDPPSPRGRR